MAALNRHSARTLQKHRLEILEIAQVERLLMVTKAPAVWEAAVLELRTFEESRHAMADPFRVYLPSVVVRMQSLFVLVCVAVG